MKYLKLCLFIIIVSVMCIDYADAQNNCYLTSSVICYDTPSRIEELFKLAYNADGQNKDQLLLILMADVFAGKAILLNSGSHIKLISVTPVITSFSLNRGVYFTLTDSFRCR